MKRFRFPAKGKPARYLIAAAAAATATGLSLHAANSDVLTLPSDYLPKVSEKIHNEINGIVRTSRAIVTVCSTVVDYKSSLRGIQVGSDEYREKLSEVHLRSANRFLKLCETNKGFYVKAGQFITAMRLVPKEYSSTLSSLQDQVVPCPFEAIKAILTGNLGPDFLEMFFSIDEQPIAAASIAQVHHAVLKDGHEVAIKVQYPGIEQQMYFDTRTMSFLAKAVAWFFPQCRFEWLVSVFAEAISLELDFVQEARNSERAAKNFRNNKWVRVPLVFWELTTRQVLTMQFYRGHKIDDLDYLNQLGVDPLEVVEGLIELFAEMIFVHGYIHGDPHPGNILVSPEGSSGFSLVLLDHGVYKELDEQMRKNYCQLWKALVLNDSMKIINLGEKFGVGMYSRYFPVIFTGRTIESKHPVGVQAPFEEKRKLKEELKSISMEDVSSFMESLPPEFVSILRVDGLLRYIIRKLGASSWPRLLAYTKYAVYGLSPKLDIESGFSAEAVVYRLKSELEYLNIRTRIVIGALIKGALYLLEKAKTASHSLYRSVVSLGIS
ncbi:hypothetical protein L6164_033090 [Bauhinia variegata]|uniref:Uncharacterized protein n=1 Tax=Bauhinia variegata TaxID=167791 RepID=A0ACB9KQX1_BAUVA|nr:hypothetical protein L6164_033090 [Bauhinia variegata]